MNPVKIDTNLKANIYNCSENEIGVTPVQQLTQQERLTKSYI